MILLLSLAAAALLFVLSYSDFRHRRLSNRVVAGYAALCPVALLVSGATPLIWLQHGIVAMVAFVLLVALFAVGVLGGGDVKLGAAVLGWAGVQSFMVSLFVIGITGLMLALLGLIADRLSAPGLSKDCNPVFRVWPAILRALSARRGVPYGVALAAGGLVVLPTYWLSF